MIAASIRSATTSTSDCGWTFRSSTLLMPSPSLRRRGLPRGLSGQAAEYRSVEQPGPARIILVEEPAHQFAGSVEARYRLVDEIEHLRVGVDLETAEGESDAAGD